MQLSLLSSFPLFYHKDIQPLHRALLQEPNKLFPAPNQPSLQPGLGLSSLHPSTEEGQSVGAAGGYWGPFWIP